MFLYKLRLGVSLSLLFVVSMGLPLYTQNVLYYRRSFRTAFQLNKETPHAAFRWNLCKTNLLHETIRLCIIRFVQHRLDT